jgi:tetratricopeptide (TPR) repeat protein/KaiC/GvpD/RAD55 family RecA-like ATPase
VLESYSEGSGFADERLNALEGLGDAYMGSGLLGEGAKAYDRLGREAESDTLKLRALRKAMFILFWRGDFTSSMQRAEEATPFCDGNRLEYARILVWKARVAGRLGNKEEAQKILLEAINIFDSEGSQGDFLRSGVEIAIFQASFGKIKDSLAILMVVANAFNAIGELRGEMYALTHLGAYLTLSSQLNEALDKEAAAIKIGERILDHQMTAWPHYFSGMIYEIKGNIKFFSLLRGFMMNTARKPSDLSMSAFFEESPEIRSNYELAVDYGLKGAGCAEKADAHYIQFLCYGNLVRAYAHLGDLESAENFLGKLKQLIPKVESSGDKDLLAGGIESEAVFLSEKRLWEKANLCFEKCIEMYQSKSEHLTLGTTMSFHTRARGEYGWCLVQQNKFADAVKQFMEIQKSWENAWSKASFVHSDVQTFMTIPREIGSGEKFSVFLNFANVAQASCRLLKIDGFVPQEFRVVSMPAFCSVQKDAMDLNSKVVGPFKVVSARVDLVASKPSVFNLTPQLTYEDDSGTTRTSKINEITLTVRPVLRAKIGEEEVSVHVLPGRVSTGFNQLDVLLLGGIPENYAMILSSPSIDEKELLIKSFLEEGAKSGEPTFLLATDAGYAKNLAETHPSSFTVFVCGPEERAVNQMSTRLHGLKGAENLTDIDIALTRFFRTLNPKSDGPRRACIDIVSDVLLQHRALNTRKWLNDLINTLKSNGFTTLAVINPQMHPQEEVHAILSLFDGEIKISEKETDKGTERTLRVRRLKNQRCLENELSISKKNL